MGCNNTLTDAQLEAMFATTDEEMRQIEQLMECLIERTQHKCKMCTRFFSNKAALKQHHCEPLIKMEYPMDTSSLIRTRFDVEVPRGKFVEISSILKGKSTWKL